MLQETKDLQVIILAGPAEVQRATFGLAAALAALASGTRVDVVFSMHGAFWVAPYAGDDRSVPGFPSVAELITQVQDLGGRVMACATCIDNYCPSPIGAGGVKELRPNVERVGLGVVAMQMSSASTVVC